MTKTTADDARRLLDSKVSCATVAPTVAPRCFTEAAVVGSGAHLHPSRTVRPTPDSLF
ncbi:hypothetical protein [Corynebacterium sp. CCM 9203]|uniref:hypothetical protein n=1 Tax=Corynebacterium sp. CCM 9203 TaxID=3057615 RepID=UPI003523F9C2